MAERQSNVVEEFVVNRAFASWNLMRNVLQQFDGLRRVALTGLLLRAHPFLIAAPVPSPQIRITTMADPQRRILLAGGSCIPGQAQRRRLLFSARASRAPGSGRLTCVFIAP